MHFPSNRSLGKLYRLKIATWGAAIPEDSPYADARGNLTVAAKVKLLLKLSYAGAADLRPLEQLTDQDVIYAIDANQVESMTDQALKEIARLKSVQELLLNATDITDKGAQQIATMTQLSHLDLCETTISAAGLNSFRSLTALKNLEMEVTPLKGTDFASLATMVHLKNLSVGRTTIADNAMKNLGKVTSLLRLKLANNSNITDAGIACLIDLKNLEELNLQYTSVTKKCLPSLQKMTHLKTLQLSLPAKELAEFQLALHKTNPGCQVEGRGRTRTAGALFEP